MSTSAALIVFRLKSFNCRTKATNLIDVKYVKIANHLGIVGNCWKGLARTSQDVFILKIWSTTDLKRNNSTVFKMKGVF